jgi:hypothetical protein
MMITIFELRQAYAEGRPVGRFLAWLRGPDNTAMARYSVKRPDLDAIFRANALWINQQKPGHQKWVHRITGVVVEYVDRKNDVDPGAALGLLSSLQRHLNILRNCIFQTPWKEAPDYEKAQSNWLKWDQGGRPIPHTTDPFSRRV